MVHEQRDECPPGDRALSGLVPAQNGPAAGSGSWQAEDAGEQTAAVVRIRLLGRFTVLRNSAEIPLRAFGGRLPQQLLRLLALRRGALIPKDVIAEALWPRGPRPTPGATSRCW